MVQSIIRQRKEEEEEQEKTVNWPTTAGELKREPKGQQKAMMDGMRRGCAQPISGCYCLSAFEKSRRSKKIYRNYYLYFATTANTTTLQFTMPPSMPKKRKVLDGLPQPKKKFKKQREYHSSSDEAEDDTDFAAVNLADSDDEDGPSKEKANVKLPKEGSNKKKETKPVKLQKAQPENADSTSAHSDNDEDDDDQDASGSDDASDSEDGSDSDASITISNAGQRSVPKRNDPSAFSTSISKILSTKLPTSARADPVLSRSKSAAQTGAEFADEKLDKQARAKLRAEKREELDRGRVRDVMGIERGETGAVAEEEKRLRKIAQRGVVKLFNAVRAAQVRGEEAAKMERQKGTIGMGEREKNVNEVSKQGFLELISGKKGKPLNIEEA